MSHKTWFRCLLDAPAISERDIARAAACASLPISSIVKQPAPLGAQRHERVRPRPPTPPAKQLARMVWRCADPVQERGLYARHREKSNGFAPHFGITSVFLWTHGWVSLICHIKPVEGPGKAAITNGLRPMPGGCHRAVAAALQGPFGVSC